MINIAIHHREGSFSGRWINYCENNHIKFFIVDCLSSDIISQLIENKATHLMWNFHHSTSADLTAFSYVLNSAENLNIATYPNFGTRWHFDDKIAQKYLLESIKAPIIESHVFYNEASAVAFIEKASLPIVAKLKRGAGSANVELIHTEQAAKEYIRQLFSVGKASISSGLENLSQKMRIAKKIKNPLHLANKVIKHIIKSRKERRIRDTEKGYVYFQKFLANNDYDTRIVVVGDIAIGFRRFNRENDFRASGSGKIDFNTDFVDTKMVDIAFKTSEKLNAQCLAYDFVYDIDKEPRIIELCFSFSMLPYDLCEGYWTKDLKFVRGSLNLQDFMMKDFLKQ